MKKGLIFGVVIVIFIAVGFGVGLAFPAKDTGCTEISCSCVDLFGESPCNTCTISDPFFVTGAVNVDKNCAIPEMMMCENDVLVGGRFAHDKGSCTYSSKVFGYQIDRADKVEDTVYTELKEMEE